MFHSRGHPFHPFYRVRSELKDLPQHSRLSRGDRPDRLNKSHYSPPTQSSSDDRDFCHSRGPVRALNETSYEVGVGRQLPSKPTPSPVVNRFHALVTRDRNENRSNWSPETYQRDFERDSLRPSPLSASKSPRTSPARITLARTGRRTKPPAGRQN